MSLQSNNYRVNKAPESEEIYSSDGIVSSSLEEIIRQQTQALEEFRGDDLIHLGDIQEETSMEEEDDLSCSQSSGRHEAYELDSTHVWSECEDCGSGKDVHGSIKAIKEEASRVDAVIALDQLDTMKEELENLRKELSGRDSEIKGLRTKIQVKDSKISTLELERQLHRADMGCDIDDGEELDDPLIVFSHSSATSSPDNTPDKEANSRYSRMEAAKAPSLPEAKPLASYSPIRKNLSEVLLDEQRQSPNMSALSRMGTKKERSLVSPPSPVRLNVTQRPAGVDSSSALAQRPDELSSVFGSEVSATDRESAYSIQAGNIPPAKIVQHIGNRYHHKQANGLHDGHMLQARSLLPESHVFTPVEEASLYTPSRRAESPYLLVPVTRVSSHPELDYQEYMRKFNGTPLTARSIDMASVSMSSCSRSRVEVGAASHSPSYSKNPYPRFQSGPKSCHSATRKSVARKYQAESFDSGTGTKTCMTLPKGNLLKLFKRRGSRQSEELSEEHSSEAEELAQLLRTSLETSDELRKRLAMINSYYENVVKEMQQSLEANNEDRQKMEAELGNEIASLKLAMKNEAIAKRFKQKAVKHHQK